MIITLFDCETTGLVWNPLLPLTMQPEMIEFACVALDLDSGKIVDGYHTLIKPQGKVPADVTKLTGITNEMLADSPSLAEVFPTIKAKLEAYPVAGHNVVFDMEIVHFAGERVKSSVSWKKSYCTVETSMNLRGKRLSLTDLFEILVGRRIEVGAHRASFDVQALVEIVLEMHKRGYFGEKKVMTISTGYSVKKCYGFLGDVIERQRELGFERPIVADVLSTHSFAMLPDDAIHAVKIPVSVDVGSRKAPTDDFTFIALDSLKPLNNLVHKAGLQGGAISYDSAMNAAQGLAVVTGPNVVLDQIPRSFPNNVHFGLSVATPHNVAQEAWNRGLPFYAAQVNSYDRPENMNKWLIALGHRADKKTYPQHIVSDKEYVSHLEGFSWVWVGDALVNRGHIHSYAASKIIKGSLPNVDANIERDCWERMRQLSFDWNPAYTNRLVRELNVISGKKFEDYFTIVAAMVKEARKTMIVGPARGSSCGSLVCYLLGITSVDPIEHGLLFERFLDLNRSDLPDIDLDFPSDKRENVFAQMIARYGENHVAKLGTVSEFKPKSILQAATKALGVPRWATEKLVSSVMQTAAGDTSNTSLRDAIAGTYVGREMAEKYPLLMDAAALEGHPHNFGQHAAGLVLSERPIIDTVAIDGATGAAMTDKDNAEKLGLIKIDILGLKQLSIFERAADLAGLNNFSEMFRNAPDCKGFDVFAPLNKGKYTGVFQFAGNAVQGVAKQIKIKSFDDLVAITSLARPGPMNSGGTEQWILRRNGDRPVSYLHPLLEPILKDTLGVLTFQEQVMAIGRLGGLSWENVTLLRKAIAKSKGKQAVEKFYADWEIGMSAQGVPAETSRKIWDEIVESGFYLFNKSHAVAYSIISLWCCWFKCECPFEFVSATLDQEDDPLNQAEMIREFTDEGYRFVPFDYAFSSDKWVANEGTIYGPFTNVKGVGDVTAKKLVALRDNGDAYPASFIKKVEEGNFWLKVPNPILSRVKEINADFSEIVRSKPVTANRLPLLGRGTSVVMVGVIDKIKTKQENSPENVAKRGHEVNGPDVSLRFVLRDDTGEIFCHVNRFEFGKVGLPILEKGGAGKSLYVVSGEYNPEYEMVHILRAKYMGAL